MQSRKWHNVPFTVSDYIEIELHGTSSGEYDPGYWRDANGDGCPPSGEDNREIVRVVITTDDGKEHIAPDAVIAWFAGIYDKQIEEATIEHDD